MTLTLTDAEIEARVKSMPLGGDLLSIVRMVRCFKRTGSPLAVKRVWKLTRDKAFDYTFADYIYRNTKIIVEVN